MPLVGRAAGAVVAVQQQDLVTGIDQRMNALAQHRRAAGPERGAEFGDGKGTVWEDRRFDGVEDGRKFG